MSKEFLDQALERLIKGGVLLNEQGKLRFTDDWMRRLLTHIKYDMDKDAINTALVKCLEEFLAEKGRPGDVRFEAAWVKHIFSTQLRGLDDVSREAVKNFFDAVNEK